MDPEISIVDIIVALTALGGAISGAVAFWAQQRERRLKAEAEKKGQDTAEKLASGEYLTDVGAAYAALAQAMELRIKTLTAAMDKLDNKYCELEKRYNELFVESVKLRSRVSILESENNSLLEILDAREAKIAALEARLSGLENGSRVDKNQNL